MREVLAVRPFARLFAAQVVALLGTGLMTIALGLLAYDLAGTEAGAVLGTALTIKMVAYVTLSPVMTSLTGRFPRKPVLVTADLVRASVALALPAVSETWHISVLIFVLQSASATFTPTFQALIPDVLPDERLYTRAQSLSRLAYDLESLLSPSIAAALLLVVGHTDLFDGTAIALLCSAALVVGTRLPQRSTDDTAPFLDRLTRGIRVVAASPQLRSLMGTNLVVAAAQGMVIVNTVVFVRATLGGGESGLALLMAAFGAGSMVVALALPRLLDRVDDRRVMLGAATATPFGMAAMAGAMSLPGPGRPAVVGLVWFALGALVSAILTPSARLIRRATDVGNRPAVFAAQFSTSHACFMLTYPLAGGLGARLGLPPTALVLAVVSALGTAVAHVAWPRPVTASPAPLP